MVDTLSIAEAKAGFAAAVRRAERGESLILTRHGRPVARLVPVARPDGESRDGEIREPAESWEARSGPHESAAELDTLASRCEGLARLLRERVWPRVPSEQLGVGVSRSERERILGYGDRGV